jgi:hypothetical protein
MIIQFNQVGACCVGIDAATVVSATRIPNSALSSVEIHEHNDTGKDYEIEIEKVLLDVSGFIRLPLENHCRSIFAKAEPVKAVTSIKYQ